jgi:opacity protein-like surface antigen
MYTKKYTPIVSACIASLVACCANAEFSSAAKTKKSYNLREHSATTEPSTNSSDKSTLLDGNNFFILKGGLSKPTHPLKATIDRTKVFDKQKPTYTVGALFGREFYNNAFALDVEYRFHPNSKSLKTDIPTRMWKLRSHNILANLKLNLVRNFAVVPYLRAGGGLAMNHTSTFVASSNVAGTSTYPGKMTSSLVWQGGMGFDFKYNDLISTNLEYLYANLGKFSTKDSRNIDGVVATKTPVSSKLTAHLVSFGLKFNF